MGGMGLINVESQSQKLFSKSLLKIITADNSKLSWENTYKLNMTKAIRLPNPLSNHTLTNYLSTHNGTLGPHYLTKRWKNVLWVMKWNEWVTSFIPTPNA